MPSRSDIVEYLCPPESHSVVIFIPLLSCGSSNYNDDMGIGLQESCFTESLRNILQGCGHWQSDKEPISDNFKQHHNQLPERKGQGKEQMGSSMDRHSDGGVEN